MIDKHLLDQIEGILARIDADISIVDKENEEDPVVRDMTDGVCQHINGRYYLPVVEPAVILSCDDEVAGAENILIMVEALVQRLGSNDNQAENRYDVYRRTLRGELTGSELEALGNEYQLPRELKRRILVFHIIKIDKERAYDLLRDLTPLQAHDELIDMDRHTVVLIKDMADSDKEEDVVEFAEALQETLMGETAHQMTVGISSECYLMDEIHGAYLDAKRSIEVGRIFQPESTVYVFNRMILERFLMELPQDISAYYHSLLFNRKTARLFNDEMLYTIDMFFKKDLNLSDTARQLYIHRNTLVYRLDKVQRETGLDLRKFEDAVTFRILMELKKCEGDTTRKK